MTTSIIAQIEGDLQTAENWTINFLSSLKTDVQILEADIIKLFQFLQPYAQTLAAGAVAVLPLIPATGPAAGAILAVATGLQAASAIVNQAVAAQQASAAAGGSNGQQVVALGSAAYAQLKQVQINLATAQAAAAQPKAATASASTAAS